MTNLRFSLRYLHGGKPEQDSPRFRKRLASYIWTMYQGDIEFEIGSFLESELGIDVIGRAHPIGGFYKDAELRDVLDSVSLIYQWFSRRGVVHDAIQWRDFARRVLREENLCYLVTDQGGVEYAVDEEFARNRAATLSALQRPELAGARTAFEDAHRHLLALPQDTKAAVKSIFEAVEIATRLLLGDASSRLTKNVCKDKLPKALAVNDSTEDAALVEICTGLGYWVDSGHHYRHGQREHEPVAPSLDFAVLFLSTGAAFLRHLALRVPSAK